MKTEYSTPLIPGQKTYSFAFSYGDNFETLLNNPENNNLYGMRIDNFPPNYTGELIISNSDNFNTVKIPIASQKEFDFMFGDERIENISWIEVKIAPIKNVNLIQGHQQENIVIVFDIDSESSFMDM